MDIPDLEPNTTRFATTRSVIHCQQTANFKWKSITIPSFLIPITSIGSLAVIFLNALVVLALQQKRELKKTCTLMLFSMAIADLLVGAISMPLNITLDTIIARQVCYPGFRTLYLATEFCEFILVWLSLYHLTVIAWERYVAIRKWMHYKVIVTRDRMRKLAIMAWLLAVFPTSPLFVMIVAGVHHKIKRIWHIGESVAGTLCLVAIGYFYIMIYLGERRRKIAVVSQVTALAQAKQEIQVTKTAGLITVALMLSFVPLLVIGATKDLFPVLSRSKALHLAETLVQLNSLANPLIYFYRDRRFRKAALELLRLRKPEAIQSAVGAARCIRRKDQLGSLLAVQERQDEMEYFNFKRAASCEPALASDCHNRGCHKIFFKRSLSAPSLNTNESEFFDAPQGSQASSIVIITAIIPTQSGLRRRLWTSTRELPKDTIDFQDTGSHVRTISRSKSLDAIASVKLVNSCHICYKGRQFKDRKQPAALTPSEIDFLHQAYAGIPSCNKILISDENHRTVKIS